MVSDDKCLVLLVIDGHQMIVAVVAVGNRDSLDVVAAVARLDSRPIMNEGMKN